MLRYLVFATLAVTGSGILDCLAIPRRGLRSRRGFELAGSLSALMFGICSAMTGSPAVSCLLVLALLLILALSSNAKLGILGEPLVFSDLVVAKSFLKEPKFYLHAISPLARAALLIGLPLMLVTLAVVSWHGATTTRIAGAITALLAFATLRALISDKSLMSRPCLAQDFARHGLLATLVLYWRRWKETPPPEPASQEPPAPSAPTLVILQCESFCDMALGSETQVDLPNLARARARAEASGRLLVSGFGAYTMRTEYGVLSGREETDLGFRAFDPFLTAGSEASHGLGNKLARLYPERLFVHPHDMKFYARDRIMPELGFTRLIGEESFRNAPRFGPYIGDVAFGAFIASLIGPDGHAPLIYGVTMENHGPWSDGRLKEAGGAEAYALHRRNSDTMLGLVMDALDEKGSDAVLVFFGDHRPSIPQHSEAGPDRSTPYVVVPFSRSGERPAASVTRDVTPAGLHRLILDAISRHRRQTAPRIAPDENRGENDPLYGEAGAS